MLILMSHFTFIEVLSLKMRIAYFSVKANRLGLFVSLFLIYRADFL